MDTIEWLFTEWSNCEKNKYKVLYVYNHSLKNIFSANLFIKCWLLSYKKSTLKMKVVKVLFSKNNKHNYHKIAQCFFVIA